MLYKNQKVKPWLVASGSTYDSLGHIRHIAASVRHRQHDGRYDSGRGEQTVTTPQMTPIRIDGRQREKHWMDETSGTTPSDRA